MGQHYERIIIDRLGHQDGGILLRTLDRQGWAVVPKAELLALRRAAAKLEKMNGSTNGTKTGRMSASKPNLAPVPTEKTSTKRAVSRRRV